MHLCGCQPVSGRPSASSRVSDNLSVIGSPSHFAVENGTSPGMVNLPVSLGLGA